MEQLANTLSTAVSLFLGLMPRQMKRVLEACKMGIHVPGEILCKYGGQSDRLFVLVSGQLEILGEDGASLATIRPVTTVGEMGFLTRKPRSASVRVLEQSQILGLDYSSFQKLIDNDFRLQARIYRNTVRLLAERLSDANDLIVRYRKLCPDKQAPAAVERAEPAAPPSEAPAPEDLEATEIIGAFYRLIGQELDPQHLAEDRVVYQALCRNWYTAEDIVYASKWTARHIPAAMRFSIVKLSIKEAFESKWSM